MPMPQEPCLPAAGQSPGPGWRPVVGRGQQRVPVHGEPVERGGHAEAARWAASAASASGSTSMNRDRYVRTPGVKVPDAELGESVVPAVGGDHVVRGLRPAVEADHRVDRPPRPDGEQSQSTMVPLPASP